MLTLQQRLPSGIACYKRGRFKAIITEQEIAGLSRVSMPRRYDDGEPF